MRQRCPSWSVMGSLESSPAVDGGVTLRQLAGWVGGPAGAARVDAGESLRLARGGGRGRCRSRVGGRHRGDGVGAVRGCLPVEGRVSSQAGVSRWRRGRLAAGAAAWAATRLGGAPCGRWVRCGGCSGAGQRGRWAAAGWWLAQVAFKRLRPARWGAIRGGWLQCVAEDGH